MDEAFGLGKFQSKEFCDKYGKDVMFTDYLNKISEHVNKKYNKKVMFWADMITNYPNAHTRIPKNATALEWGYELIQSQTMAEHCWAFQQKGSCPARRPVENAICILYPPVLASRSSTSPAKYKPLTLSDSIVYLFTSSHFTPPAVTTAYSNGA